MSDAKASLEGIRVRRRTSILRAVNAARMAVRAERSDLARIAREWNAISKRINSAIGKYEKAIEELDLGAPERLAPRDLLACLKGCVEDEQTNKLDEIEASLAADKKLIEKAGRKRKATAPARAKRREKRTAKRMRQLQLG